MEKENKIAVGYRLTPLAVEALKRWAVVRGISQAAVLELMIREGLAREKKAA